MKGRANVVPCGRWKARGAVLSLALLSTSCGTVLTRTRGDVFGYYPYEALVADAKLIGYSLGFDIAIEGTLNRTPADDGLTAGLLSLPLDLVLDTIALPIDLVAWAFGGDKRTLGMAPREMERGN